MFTDSNLQPSFTSRNYFAWFVLAFQAGIINMGAFLACNRFVTHVTGFATHFGEELSAGQTTKALSVLSVPLCFMTGSMISGVLIDARKLRGKKPNYPYIFFFMCLLMVVVSIAGGSGAFGFFGHTAQADQINDYFLLALLSVTSGMQNGVITTASGAVVRTTHLTGIVTDLGLGIVRVLTPSFQGDRRTREIRSNVLRSGTITAFVLGSACAAYLFRRFHYYGFFLPAVIYLIFWFFVRHLLHSSEWRISKLVNEPKTNPEPEISPEPETSPTWNSNL